MPRRRLPIDLSTPRTASEIVGTAIQLYIRYPWLFLLLAFIVVAPYELIVLAVTGAAPFGQENTSVRTSVILTLIGFALLGQLVSAFQVQAVGRLAEGGRPQVREVIWNGLRVLPVVTAAEIVAGLGILVGLFFFFVPGLVLAARWGVVAQTAAFERTDWLGALRRGSQLTLGHYLHVLGLLLFAALIEYGVLNAGALAAGPKNGTLQVVVGIAAVTISRSFTALTTAILYFELRGRAAVARSAGPGVL